MRIRRISTATALTIGVLSALIAITTTEFALSVFVLATPL